MAGTTEAAQPAPPGYRWVNRAWRLRADGTRDYALQHNMKCFRELKPLSARLRTRHR